MRLKTHRTPWRTVFRARATVAETAATKPNMLKLGSKPDATTTPSTTGMSAAYTDGASRLPMMMAAIAAVKKGVVDPIACGRVGMLMSLQLEADGDIDAQWGCLALQSSVHAAKQDDLLVVMTIVRQP